MICFLAGGLLWQLQALHGSIAAHTEVGVGFVASILFVTGGAFGLITIANLKRNCRILANTIDRMTRERKLDALTTGNSVITPLVTAMNDMVEAADHCMSDAVMKIKELEIQLKVATAERQHAEAIIYSISDAVLVTDTFDELVLANESAARTFQFDLDRSRRLPVGQVVAR